MTSRVLKSLINHGNAVFVTLALTACMASAHAASLVLNGSFESTLLPNTPGQIGTNFGTQAQQATHWTTDGYNFLFTPGSADTVGSAGLQYGALTLWGPSNGSANGLPSSSPDGGNFIGMDGAYEVGPLQQTIHGLVARNTYTVGFWFAGAQQAGFNGLNTEQFQVSLGSDIKLTDVLHNTDEGFTGWQHVNFDFTADGTSDVLSFLAIGTPDGVPPFSLLDGVTMNADVSSPVPEPASIALLLTGVAGVGGMVRGRLHKPRA